MVLDSIYRSVVFGKGFLASVGLGYFLEKTYRTIATVHNGTTAVTCADRNII